MTKKFIDKMRTCASATRLTFDVRCDIIDGIASVRRRIMLKKFDSSRKATFVCLLSMLAIMLCANILSPAASDDFTYMYSFAPGRERIESFSDIFASLKAHGETMNGRYTAHLFAHMFLMIPGVVFDFVNSLVFVLQVFLIYKMSTFGKREKNLLLLGIFGMLWLCQSDFGQVNLWLDGACNYLWSVFFGILFLLPYVFYMLYDRTLPLPWLIPFLIIAFMQGGFMENVSPAFILMAGLFTLLSKVLFGKRIRYEQVLGIISSLGGFILMMSAPGEWINKASDGEASTLLTTSLIAFGVLLTLALPIALYVLFLRRAQAAGTNKETIVTSLIFVTGALASNFIMVVAAYYPLRCSIACTTLIIMADALLYAKIPAPVSSKPTDTASKLLLLSMALCIVIGLADITYSYVQIKSNEDYIYECKERGITEIEIPNPKRYTKYSELYFLKYIDCEDPESWPNNVMAKYYGVNSIIGKGD